ncbi:hypothetical protein M2318_001989 [Metapseudomonas resinovorans]
MQKLAAQGYAGVNQDHEAGMYGLDYYPCAYAAESGAGLIG